MGHEATVPQVSTPGHARGRPAGQASWPFWGRKVAERSTSSPAAREPLGLESHVGAGRGGVIPRHLVLVLLVRDPRSCRAATPLQPPAAAPSRRCTARQEQGGQGPGSKLTQNPGRRCRGCP